MQDLISVKQNLDQPLLVRVGIYPDQYICIKHPRKTNGIGFTSKMKGFLTESKSLHLNNICITTIVENLRIQYEF